MPPRGGRGGRGRGGSRGAKSTNNARSNPPQQQRGRRNGIAKINGHSFGQDGIHAFFNEPGLLTIAGLAPEHFPNYDSALDEDADEDGASDSHSDYGSGSAIAKTTPRKSRNAATAAASATEGRMQDAEHGASNPGTLDGDWTETDVEVFVAPKTRGFYRPPPRREVVRQKVKKSESSRYNSAIPKVRPATPVNGEEGETTNQANEDDQPLSASRKSSQKSNQNNEDLPVIVEQEATEDEAAVEAESEPKETKVTNGRGGRRGGRKKKSPTPEAPRPEIIDEGELSDSNFPDPYREKPPVPHIRHCEDKADWIMRKKFAPMGDPQAFINSLTKFDPATRSTEVLYAIALNAQKAIKAWQDEYLKLDLITAPKANPPKKPLTGGRTTIDPLIYDDMLEADLYGYTYDAKKQPGQQDPFRQRAGGGKFVGGRELRQRRGRDVGAVDLSEPELTNTEGYGTRRRRAAQRQMNNSAAASNTLEVPARRGVKRVNSYGASDDGGPPRKRGRPSAAEKSAMQSRVQQLREESAVVSNASELDGQSPEPSSRRRGRPPGSKNTMPRSDAGIKKGPRKSRLTSATGDSEDASMLDNETPMSGQDSMDIDEVAPGTVNGGDSTGGALNGTAPSASVEGTSVSTGTPTPAADSKDPKKRVRSEKRSKSMTEWWAARKAKAAEDRKAQLAAQAEADRVAEEQARAAHAAHQAQFPPQDARYWPQLAVAPQHQHVHSHGLPHTQLPLQTAYPGPPPPVPQPPVQHVAFTGPQPSKDMMRLPQTREPPPPRQVHIPGPPPPGSRPEAHHQPVPAPPMHPSAQRPPSASGPLSHQQPPRPLHRFGPPLGQPPTTQQPPPPPGLPSASLLNARPPTEGPPLHHNHHAPSSHRPPPGPFSGSPTQPQPAQQHVFHHHPAPPPPPTPLQFSPPSHHQSPGVGIQRQPSPLRRIINYVSDPSKAAQPTGPPYQSIMTPGGNVSGPASAGAGSPPTLVHHHSHGHHRQASTSSVRPESRGQTRTPPAGTGTTAPPSASSTSAAPAGSFMSAFHINNSAGRPPIPGTGSFRPNTPGKSTFTHYTVYTPPAGRGGGGPPPPPPPQAGQGGRMTGAQVQDLALAAVQPMARKPIEDVLKEQREVRDQAQGGSQGGWKGLRGGSATATSPTASLSQAQPGAGMGGRDRSFHRLQAAPQQSLPPLGSAGANAGDRPPSRSQQPAAGAEKRSDSASAGRPSNAGYIFGLPRNGPPPTEQRPSSRTQPAAPGNEPRPGPGSAASPRVSRPPSTFSLFGLPRPGPPEQRPSSRSGSAVGAEKRPESANASRPGSTPSMFGPIPPPTPRRPSQSEQQRPVSVTPAPSSRPGSAASLFGPLRGGPSQPEQRPGSAASVSRSPGVASPFGTSEAIKALIRPPQSRDRDSAADSRGTGPFGGFGFGPRRDLPPLFGWGLGLDRERERIRERERTLESVEKKKVQEGAKKEMPSPLGGPRPPSAAAGKSMSPLAGGVPHPPLMGSGMRNRSASNSSLGKPYSIVATANAAGGQKPKEGEKKAEGSDAAGAAGAAK